MSDKKLEYTGSILDAHTHAIDDDGLDLLVDVQRKFGVSQAVLICHSLEIMKYADRTYPGRFIFAHFDLLREWNQC
jgi:hypothetical protein